MPQHGQQRVAGQRVDLVDQQHERPRVGRGPARQRLQQRLVRRVGRQQVPVDALQELVAPRPRPGRQPAQHDADRLLHVLTGRLRHLDVGVHATVAVGVEPLAQRQQGRGLARLPRRVEHEVALVADEPQQIVEVQAAERRNAVVVRRHHRAGRVEETHATAPRRRSVRRPAAPRRTARRRARARAPTASRASRRPAPAAGRSSACRTPRRPRRGSAAPRR